MSWEDTNPPERDEPEFCGWCAAPLPDDRVWICEDCERSHIAVDPLFDDPSTMGEDEDE